MNRSLSTGVLLAAGSLALAASGFGCSGRASLFPNPDAGLRKPMEKFSADAAKRFPYKNEAAKGDIKESPARAEVAYDYLKQINIVNLSNADYTDVEIWVNRKYVVYVPKMESKVLKRLDFKMIFDDNGNYFSFSKEMPHVDHVEMLKDGKIYEMPIQLAD